MVFGNQILLEIHYHLAMHIFGLPENKTYSIILIIHFIVIENSKIYCCIRMYMSRSKENVSLYCLYLMQKTIKGN